MEIIFHKKLHTFPLRDYSFSTKAKFFEKLVHILPPDNVGACMRGQEFIFFSENFNYVLNEWSFILSNFAEVYSRPQKTSKMV